MKNKEVLKMFYRIIITIVLTLGLSMSFQSVLADWRQPTADPPDDNVNPPIVNEANPLDYNLNDVAILGQSLVTISGDLGLVGNLTVGGLTNCDTIDTDASGNFVCGTDDSGMGSLPANSVGSAEVIDNSLTADDLATGSVGSAEVIDNSLTAADLAPNSVGTSEIINSEVQNRVTSSCSYGINRINENGTVSCSDGNPAYSGGNSLSLSGGRYMVFMNGWTYVTDPARTAQDIKIVVTSPCENTTYTFGYNAISDNGPVSASFFVNLSCSICSSPQLQEMCGMMGFTVTGYTAFFPAACGAWVCMPDMLIPSNSIYALKVN